MRPLATVALLLALAAPSQAQTIAKSYSYFSVGGTTLDEIVKEFSRRGPSIEGIKGGHPGATRMQFVPRFMFREGAGRCAVQSAKVTLKARIILPKWGQRKRAAPETRFVWDTLSSDIKRHEESHVSIAKNHARELEQALQTLRPERGCAALEEKAKVATIRILTAHVAAQDEFDRSESKNFQARLDRLIRYRLEQLKTARAK